MLPVAASLLGAVLGAVVVWRVMARPATADGALAIGEMERLRRAEMALAGADSTLAAARELGKHAMVLLDAPAAVVLIEGVGGTERMEVGDAHGYSLYGPGSRMRLLDDNGVPCGSIAVASRADRPYCERDERILDALAQRVSGMLHRLSLFEAVRTEQRALADVVASSSDGIMSVGLDLRVRAWNPAMARITGIPEPVALGKPCCAVFRPLDEDGHPLHGTACPCRGADLVETLASIGEAAGRRWLNCAFSPMSDGGSVVIARDVTARKQMEDDKADFLATVSHELRTPLTPIKGFLQTLQRRDQELSTQERHHIYEVVLREEGRLERLVQQLLQATSLEQAGEALIVAETVDWAQVVRERLDEARRQDPAREMTLVVPPVLPMVVADEQLSGQVVSNLLSNAMKYSPPGSSIGMAVAHDGERVVTTVVDRGPGIVAADRDRIFDKFTRLGNHLTRPQQGVGLGLYIVRRSVEAMGGTVWVDDVPGGGCAFSFSLRVSSQPNRDTTPARLRASATARARPRSPGAAATPP
ncbi:MAG: ATP-binding protein [Acidimicrobiia bacterium]